MKIRENLRLTLRHYKIIYNILREIRNYLLLIDDNVRAKIQ